MRLNVLFSFFYVLCFIAFRPPLMAQPDNRQASAPKSQPSESQLERAERNVGTVLATLQQQSKDLEDMAKSLKSGDFQVAMELDHKLSDGAMQLDATLLFLGLYRHMGCDADRVLAKSVLENRLDYYSGLLSAMADQVTGYMPLTNSVALAQEAQKSRDALRLARNTLDAISPSLK
jgi:hypothetical protein